MEETDAYLQRECVQKRLMRVCVEEKDGRGSACTCSCISDLKLHAFKTFIENGDFLSLSLSVSLSLCLSLSLCVSHEKIAIATIWFCLRNLSSQHSLHQSKHT